jgi:hypothetical protein
MVPTPTAAVPDLDVLTITIVVDNATDTVVLDHEIHDERFLVARVRGRGTTGSRRART